ncbi:membrane glycoprotein US3 [Panine betaherpesvirus 2]|uniref:Membrane glycoprotein US3 n=1 Tax=Panine betaherpesvirus 2 TaxID=188763 RepID=Q8QRV4_9BETA|nr:membrane glycoprotein US3 [Panine betaherpesvirus 2]AAM00784.1 membrane glycoprotein US3 [Panine betaherpesvirus 2]QXV67898.1 membrane glycoprotein US3 [Panine betaherpesvirus 2]
MKLVIVLAALAALLLGFSEAFPRPVLSIAQQLTGLPTHFLVEENECRLHMGKVYFRGKISGNFTKRHFVQFGIQSRSYRDNLEVTESQWSQKAETYFEWNVEGIAVPFDVDTVDVLLSSGWGEPKKWASCDPQVQMDYSSWTVGWYFQRAMRDDNWGLFMRTVCVYVLSMFMLAYLTVGMSLHMRFF